MAYLSPIVSHEGRIDRCMGLRRALITRRANLADGFDVPSVVRRLLSESSMRYPAAVIPLARKRSGEHSAVELALQVSAHALAAIDRETIGGIAYCHAAPDEQPTDSSVGRLQFELGLHRAFPFSVSQAHNTGVPIALDLAAALIHGPEAAQNVLVVATDKLLFGPAPHQAHRMRWRDVAAAVVVGREKRGGWQLHQIAVHHFATDVQAHQRWPEAEVDAFAAFCADRIAGCMDALGLGGDELAAVVPVCPDATLERKVHALAGLGTRRHEKPAGFRAAHIASADLLVRLSGLESQLDIDRPVLAWCTGNNGEFACCVLTRTA
ncbi:hypothetical protein QTH90_24145 [Variovorax sp. J2P1-59]|uniref:hypothetical protein n=1 Tax=Variovorax flavidus TaxID=3053501 RepID=UPI0025749E39|nr:hypothetical protein [Variovorax sp. J2P1-59]MDM0077519.1 hypothetical protein [Variovorax sp. J2P1-59]